MVPPRMEPAAGCDCRSRPEGAFKGLLRMSDETGREELVERHERFVVLWLGRTPPELVVTTPAELRAGIGAMSEIVGPGDG